MVTPLICPLAPRWSPAHPSLLLTLGYSAGYFPISFAKAFTPPRTAPLPLFLAGGLRGYPGGHPRLLGLCSRLGPSVIHAVLNGTHEVKAPRVAGVPIWMIGARVRPTRLGMEGYVSERPELQYPALLRGWWLTLASFRAAPAAWTARLADSPLPIFLAETAAHRCVQLLAELRDYSQ